MRAIKQLLWWLIAGSEGGYNRAMIIHVLNDRPCNANQLAKELGLDYKTIRHHLDVLTKNNLLTLTGGKYGKMYFISAPLEENYEVFEEIWDKIGKKKIKEKNR
jgi:DNA-binding transcriptional ArsR family regulator